MANVRGIATEAAAAIVDAADRRHRRPRTTVTAAVDDALKR